MMGVSEICLPLLFIILGMTVQSEPLTSNDTGPSGDQVETSYSDMSGLHPYTATMLGVMEADEDDHDDEEDITLASREVGAVKTTPTAETPPPRGISNQGDGQTRPEGLVAAFKAAATTSGDLDTESTGTTPEAASKYRQTSRIQVTLSPEGAAQDGGRAATSTTLLRGDDQAPTTPSTVITTAAATMAEAEAAVSTRTKEEVPSSKRVGRIFSSTHTPISTKGVDLMSPTSAVGAFNEISDARRETWRVPTPSPPSLSSSSRQPDRLDYQSTLRRASATRSSWLSSTAPPTTLAGSGDEALRTGDGDDTTAAPPAAVTSPQSPVIFDELLGDLSGTATAAPATRAVPAFEQLTLNGLSSEQPPRTTKSEEGAGASESPTTPPSRPSTEGFTAQSFNLTTRQPTVKGSSPRQKPISTKESHWQKHGKGTRVHRLRENGAVSEQVDDGDDSDGEDADLSGFLDIALGDMPLHYKHGRLAERPPPEKHKTPIAAAQVAEGARARETAALLDDDVTSAADSAGSARPVTSEGNQTAGAVGRRRRRKTLHLGGLFELSDTAAATNGRSELAAALMAVDHINEQNVIPGYTLKLLHNDTKCDPGYGADAFYDLVYRKPTLIMLIGSSCSEVTKTLAEIVPYWHLVQISYAATSPALSKREKYPNFYRLAAADSSHNAARKTLIQHFGWDTVAILHQDLETFSLAVNDMHATFNKVNITVKATLTFRGVGTDLHAKMLDLNAYRLGMRGPRYVWMLVGGYTERWWTQGAPTRCTADQLATVVDGYFSVDALSSIIGNRTSRSGLTTRQFMDEYDRLNLARPRSAYAQVTYDTVWTVALTLQKTMKMWQAKGNGLTLDRFAYRTGSSMSYDFIQILGNLEFMGVSGPVSFDGPDRRGITVLEQNQGGVIKRIALFYPENNTLDFKCLGCKPIVWKGGKIPADKYTLLTRREHIEPGAFITVCACGSVGILVASFFLGFNLYHRKLKYIKLSSPKLNNVAVIGCIHVYLAVILLGFDDATLDVTYFPVMCTVRAFLLAAGFSLAFGAMFTKTYRVHQIFTRAHSGLVKSKLLKDTQLLFIVAALLVVDVSIIGLWVSLDPMHRSVTNFTSVPSEEDKDLLYIPQLAKCDSSHLDKWLGAFYAYKGLLLLFGVYMAWETRHVKIPVLNDSQYIGMNIYNVVLMSVTVVALSTILTDRPTLSYAVVSALIILSTTGLLGLLFLPKIYAIIKHNGSPIITSAGLTVEANTRRFAVDEKKELYYRAEVQNRVYKRELVELDISIYQLDQEMARLERLLTLPGGGQTYHPPPHVEDDLLYLLPEGQRDADTPTRTRKRKQELVRCDSSTFITDAADVCADLPEINLSCLDDEKRKLEKKDSGFHTMSFKNSNFMTAEEENPRGPGRQSGMVVVGGGGCSGGGGGGSSSSVGPVDDHQLGVNGEQLASSPESELFLARPAGPTHPPLDGGAKYTQLRRQSSTDGDMDERESLLVGSGGGGGGGESEEEQLNKNAHIESATVLVNKPGLRSQSDHTLGRRAQPSVGAAAREHFELREITPGEAYGGHRQRTNTLPPSGGVEKQAAKPAKIRRVKMSETLVQSQGPPQKASKPTASTSQQQQQQQQQHPEKQQQLQQRTLTETERRRKIQVLQRELARIQKELKSLGELEIEVSYV